MKRLVLLVLLWLVALPAAAWPDGKRAAIVLTYDDALASHLDIAIPQLDATGLKGTFFLDGDITPADMLRWRQAAANGHELGNHSVYHPCPRGMVPQNDHYATDTYTPQSMVREIAVMNNVLFGIDGKTRRTMAYPCAQTLAGGVDFVDELKASGVVTYVRTGGDPWSSVIADPSKLDLFRVPGYGPDNEPGGAELIAYVERVEAVGGVGVLVFHGTGGDYLKVSAEAHQAVVTYLKDHPEIWVATFQEVMDYVATNKPAEKK